ncbi:alpha-protein kinase 1-like [Clytia hemisphaerica]|uniref:Cnidarian restricted protein n=1 Tax=Clytia hemisphaerica TaxID=252671 RepID=A0A7M5XA93_9CNID
MKYSAVILLVIGFLGIFTHAQNNGDSLTRKQDNSLTQSSSTKAPSSTVVDQGKCNQTCIILISAGGLSIFIICLVIMIYYAVCKDKDKNFVKHSRTFDQKYKLAEQQQQQKQATQNNDQKFKKTVLDNPYASNASTAATSVTNLSTSPRIYPQAVDYIVGNEIASVTNYSNPYAVDNFGDTYLTPSPYSNIYLQKGVDVPDVATFYYDDPNSKYAVSGGKRQQIASIPQSPSSPLDGLYSQFNFNGVPSNNGSFKSNKSSSSATNRKKGAPNQRNMVTIQEGASSEHLKVPTCGGNVALKKNVKKTRQGNVNDKKDQKPQQPPSQQSFPQQYNTGYNPQNYNEPRQYWGVNPADAYYPTTMEYQQYPYQQNQYTPVYPTDYINENQYSGYEPGIEYDRKGLNMHQPTNEYPQSTNDYSRQSSGDYQPRVNEHQPTTDYPQSANDYSRQLSGDYQPRVNEHQPTTDYQDSPLPTEYLTQPNNEYIIQPPQEYLEPTEYNKPTNNEYELNQDDYDRELPSQFVNSNDYNEEEPYVEEYQTSRSFVINQIQKLNTQNQQKQTKSEANVLSNEPYELDDENNIDLKQYVC